MIIRIYIYISDKCVILLMSLGCNNSSLTQLLLSKNNVYILLPFPALSCKGNGLLFWLFKFSVCPTQYLKWYGIHIFIV